MTQPDIDPEIREAFERVQRVTAAHRILPEHLKEYVRVDTTTIDWLGLVENVDRPGRSFILNTEDRAAVAVIAHLLGFPEALRVAPAHTFMELLEMLERNARVEVLAELTLLHAMIDL